MSVIDLTIENGSVVAIPRFPMGWGLKVQNHSDNAPTTIFGGAIGSAAELRAEDLKCLFEIENGIPGTPRVEVCGSIAISTGEHERRIVLRKNQIVLEKSTPLDEHGLAINPVFPNNRCSTETGGAKAFETGDACRRGVICRSDPVRRVGPVEIVYRFDRAVILPAHGYSSFPREDPRPLCGRGLKLAR